MKRYFLKTDFLLIFVVIILLAIGNAAVFSSSYYELAFSLRLKPYKFFEMNLLYSALGLASMLFFSYYPFERIKKYLILIVGITLFFMIYVVYYGVEIKGAKRWIDIGYGVRFMPLELTKVCLIFVFAYFSDYLGEHIKTFRSFACLLVILVFFLALAIPQSDFATLVLLALLVGLIMFVNGVRFGYLLGLGFLSVLGCYVLVRHKAYRMKRLIIWKETFLDREYVFSDAKRQIINSIYAISSGEQFGRGVGMSEFSKLRLPDCYSDFIFAIIVEETGFFGAIVLMALYAVMIYRIFIIAMDCDDVFGFTIASGTGILITLQVLVNIGVTLAILPTTGIPLPFVSKGGSSIVVLLTMIGIVLNISSRNTEKKLRKDAI